MPRKGLPKEKAIVKAKLKIALNNLDTEKQKDFLSYFDDVRVGREESIKKAARDLKEVAKECSVNVENISSGNVTGLINSVDNFINSLYLI